MILQLLSFPFLSEGTSVTQTCEVCNFFFELSFFVKDFFFYRININCYLANQ